jgi:hypothetical protein
MKPKPTGNPKRFNVNVALIDRARKQRNNPEPQNSNAVISKLNKLRNKWGRFPTSSKITARTVALEFSQELDWLLSKIKS